jgi:acyl-CoA dehydrogenase
MSRSSEERALLAETADKLFAGIASGEQDRAEAIAAASWHAIEESGITALFVPEDEGGFGGTWEDAFVLLHAVGVHGVSLPIAETLLARRLLRQAQIEAPLGPIAVAICEGAQLRRGGEAWRLVSRARAVPWGNAVEHVVVVAVADGIWKLALVGAASARVCSPRFTIAQEPLAELHFDGCEALGVGSFDEDPRLASALMRASMMAGALSATLNLSVRHANERQQFGRPIGKFQAIQHALALLANEVAAVSCAALAACRAADRGAAELEIAAAKLRANRAAGMATSIAHQVHGAIGFTMEHRLHRATQRLWSWRSEYGNDRYWAARLGKLAAACGPEGLWRQLTL